MPRKRPAASVDDDFECEEDDDDEESEEEREPDHNMDESEEIDEPEDEIELAHKQAPAPERRVFSTWADCDSFIEKYFARTKQPMRLRSTVSVTSHNKDTLAKKAQRDAARSVEEEKARLEGRRLKEVKNRGVALIPSQWDRYNRMWVCTHTGEYVSRGKGIRKKKKSRAAKCESSYNACVRKGKRGEYQVELTKCGLEHSHALSDGRYQSYPKTRLQLDDQALHEVELLRRCRAPTEEIHRHIMESTPSNPRRYDIRNLVWRMKQSASLGGDVTSRIQAWVDQFTHRRGNIGCVFHDEDKIATAIVFQTLHMRRMLVRYPEVVMIDATHDTNAEGYKLFSFMVVDAFGDSQFVQHAFIRNERKETITTVVQQFIQANPSAKEIKCFMVDKNFTEIAVLRTEFDAADVLLCQFHAVKYLREVVAKYDLSPQQRASLQDALGLIVYAQSEHKYNQILSFIKRVLQSQHRVSGDVRAEVDAQSVADDGVLLSSDGSGFFDYFVRNWHDCRGMWCSYLRDNVESIGVNTNNRLEATWRHVKTLVRRTDHLDETLGHVEYYQRTLETEYRHNANPITRTINDDYDEVINDFANQVTDYAVELVFPEYKFATRAVYQYDLVDGNFVVQSTRCTMHEPTRTYVIDRKQWTCSCFFNTARKLPCRHILSIRTKEGLESVFPPARRIAKRWLLRHACDSKDESEGIPEDTAAFCVREVLPRFGGRALTRSEKFSAARELADRVCSAFADLGMPKFKEAMAALEMLGDFVLRDAGSELTRRLNSPDLSANPDSLSSNTPSGTPSGTPSDVSRVPDSNTVEDDTSCANLATSCDIADERRSSTAGEGDAGDGNGGSDADREGDGCSDGEEDRRSSEDDGDDDAPAAYRVVEAVRPRGISKTKAKRKRQADRYAATQQAVALLDHGVSFATYFFEESMDNSTVKRLVDVTTQLKEDTVPVDANGKGPAKPTAFRLTTKGAKVLSNFQIFSVLPLPTTRLARDAIVKFQKANQGVPENDIIVQVPGKGMFFTTTIHSMHRWHGAANFAKRVKAAFRWFCDVSGHDVDDDWLEVPGPSEVQARLESLVFTDPKVDAYDFVGASKVTDGAISAALEGLFVDEPVVFRVCTVEEKTERQRRNRTEKRKGRERLEERDTLLDVCGIQEWAAEHCDIRWLFIPVFFAGLQHWSAVCIDQQTKTIYYFDPSGQKKLELHEVAKKDFTRIVSDSFRVRCEQPFVQTDGYSCGVFVLMFAETRIHDRVFPHVDRNLLQYLRYRYLSISL